MAAAVFLYLGSSAYYGSGTLDYLLVNLFLAFIPVPLAYGLLGSERRRGWGDLRTVLWGVAWLGFLPNSFYVVTDLTHVFEDPYQTWPLLAASLVILFAALSMAAGFWSLYTVHRAAGKRLRGSTAYLVVELVLLLSSLGVYLGKVQRWNTWDIVTRPVEIATASIRLLLTPTFGVALITTFFFVTLSGVYAVIWFLSSKKRY